MEHLGVLEKKIGALIERQKADTQLIVTLQAEVSRLQTENRELMEQLTLDQGDLKTELAGVKEERDLLLKQVEKLEDNLLARHQNLEVLSQERELTRMAVDDLIRDIDSIVGG